MLGSVMLTDLFLRGATCGGLLVLGLGVACTGHLSRRVRLVVPLTCASLIGWLITVSPPAWSLFGMIALLRWVSFPCAGLFWLMIRTLFDDRPPRRLDWAPACALLVVRGASAANLGPVPRGLWFLGNIGALLLVGHAAFLVIRGWRDDLLEGRRRLRGVVLGAAVLFALWQGILGMAGPPLRAPVMLFVDRPQGVALFGVLLLAVSVLFLEARPALFGARVARVAEKKAVVAPRSPAPPIAPDEALLDRLQAAMDAGAWQREGLTIGALAETLQMPEHQLRRLINDRLGFRNFADFLNTWRLARAKQCLSDPARRHETVAAIAFSLGYGSLGPFNRAFRAATGTTPTAWRAEALKASPNS